MKEQLIIKESLVKTGVFVVEYGNNEKAFIDKNGIWSLCVNSSAIQEWTWHSTTGQFIVQYKSSNKRYVYEGVPLNVVWELLMADSVGQFIAKRIKPEYSVA